MLTDAGAAMTPMIIGVHVKTGGGERVDHGSVASGVLADAVQQLHDPAGGVRRLVHVVDDGDAVGISELGCTDHAPSLRRVCQRADAATPAPTPRARTRASAASRSVTS